MIAAFAGASGAHAIDASAAAAGAPGPHEIPAGQMKESEDEEPRR